MVDNIFAAEPRSWSPHRRLREATTSSYRFLSSPLVYVGGGRVERHYLVRVGRGFRLTGRI